MKNFLVFVSLIMTACLVHAGGVRVGNGGNIVRCEGETSFQSLEYVLAKGMYGNKILPTHVSTLNQSFQRLSSLIAEKAPAFVESFNHFVANYKNTNNTKDYVWISGAISPLGEETIYLPYSCKNNKGTTEIVQAIIRKPYKNKDGQMTVRFYYDPEALEKVENKSAVQLSFLIVHEWIWDLTNDPKKNRQLDYFLHSSYFDSMTSDEVSDELTRLGF